MSIAGRIGSPQSARLSAASTKLVSLEATNGINATAQPISPASSSSLPPAPPFCPSSVWGSRRYFPTTDELEEMENLTITDNEHSPSTPQHPHHHTIPNDTSRPIPISFPTKSLPALPFDLSQRPSSIPPTHDALMGSRPPTPAARSPSSRTIPRGPSERTDEQELLELPESTVCTPKELYHYMHNTDYGVLILDLRPREEFERERIKASAIICLEPMVLGREKYVSARLRWPVLLTLPEHH